MTSKFNQDHILQAFYQERKHRGKAAKRHSLLQKNMSYFVMNQQDKQNSLDNVPMAHKSSKSILNRKKNLQSYQNNLKQFTQNLKNMRKSTDSKLQTNSNKIFISQTVQNSPAELSKYQSIERSPEFKFQPQRDSDFTDYSSPKFTSIAHQKFDINFNNQSELSHKQYENIEHRHQYSQQKSKYSNGKKCNTSEDIFENNKQLKQMNTSIEQVQFLKQRIQALQKINKKQSKFIDSVYKMRRTVQNIQDDCSLKDLWRWLKSLPTSSQIQ